MSTLDRHAVTAVEYAEPDVRAVARAEPAPSLLRNALIPISVVLSFALYYQAHWSLPAITLVLATSMLTRALIPRWAERSRADFDRDAIGLVASRRLDALRSRLRRATGMRWFGAPALVAEREGMVAAERGEMKTAYLAYERALSGYEGAAPISVVLGYAHASRATGHDDEAEKAYRAVLDAGLPRVHVGLAHVLARADRALDEAEALLDKAEPQARDEAQRAEIALVRALVLVRRGKKKKARAALSELEVPEPLEALADEIKRALER